MPKRKGSVVFLEKSGLYEWSAGICVKDPRSQKRDPPNFLYVVLDRTACAPFYTERRIECAEPTKLRRKSETWGTHHLSARLLWLRSEPDAGFSNSRRLYGIDAEKIPLSLRAGLE